MKRALFVSCALFFGACTTQHDIGSTCIDGICLTSPPIARKPCMIATGKVQIEASSAAPDDMCIVDRVFTDEDEMAPCRMFFSPGDASRACDDLGLLDTVGVAPDELRVCEIPQLDVSDRRMRGGTLTGWYLEGAPLPPADTCAATAIQHARFDGALPTTGTAWLTCVDAYAPRNDVEPRLDPEDCAALPPLPSLRPNDVGAVCSTRFVPAEGFYTDRTYVDADSEQCESGVCLVDATRSPRPWPCEDESSDDCVEPDLSNNTYCSCRCNSNGDTSRVACQCPSGFTCREVVSPDAPAVLAGGYCTRESAF